MKFFPIHILIKDSLFMMLYFIIMKFNLTNETFLPKTISEFPAASQMSFSEMIFATLFYNWVPILISFVIYYPIVLLGKKVLKFDNNKYEILFIGLLLSLTTPLIYVFGYKIDLYSMKKAEIISWILTFILSISTYYFLNKPKNDIIQV